MFPEGFSWPLEKWVNGFLDWLVTTHGHTFEAINWGVLQVLIRVERGLAALPWWLIIAIMAGLAWHASRSWRLPLLVIASFLLIGSLGLWAMAVQSMALMIVAVLIAVLIGVPLGVLMAELRAVELVLRPILDLMQTMPPFVYLVPAVMLFGLGKVPAIVATVIYAVPPLVRLTSLGIKLVDSEVIEASQAFGTGRMAQLLKVQLPLALPNIMAGINQCTMMALGMVVIASMIGARGLGEHVLTGIQRLDVGKAVAGGLAIVALAVTFDRITQAYGQRLMRYRQVQDNV
ncbi:MAG: proline/glycine betaine ABC transporter permease [Hyphomicrobiaceae bacterium]